MKENILIVDDAEFSRSVMRQALLNAGFDNIIEATTAEEARKLVASKEIDLTILDIMLPDNNDLKLLYEILAINKEAKVAVISAINKPEITREALLAGARGFITKPFNETDFLCKVRMALED
ncbi:MAG: response regulator [Clostridia bacterium]|nr:response regulator [Clostridia bacterium]